MGRANTDAPIHFNFYPTGGCMIKSLPAIEKEFNMKEVEKANPSWLRAIMIAFVIIIIFGAVWADWANAAKKSEYYSNH